MGLSGGLSTNGGAAAASGKAVSTGRLGGIGAPALIPAATRTEANYQTNVSDGTNTVSNSCLQHVMRGSGANIQVALPTFAGLGVYANPGTYTYNGSIEIGDQLIPITWNSGQPTVTVLSGTIVPPVSDPVALSFSDGDIIYSHNHLVLGSSLAAPTLSLGANGGAGGTNRFWKITARTATQESVVSAEFSALVGGGQTQVLNWTAVPTATAYYLWGATGTNGQTGATSLVAIIPAGTLTYTDTGTALTAGSAPGKWPITYQISTANGESLTLGTGASDLTTSRHQDIATGGSTQAFGPSAILTDRRQQSTKPFVVGVGDSIMGGFTTGSSDGSFFNLALGGSMPVMNMGVYAEMFIDVAPSTLGGTPTTVTSGSGGFFMPHRGAMVEAADAVICEYGSNDFQNSKTLVQVQGYAINLWSWMAGFASVWQTTCLPRPSASTDGWTTVGGQTIATWDAIRVSWNTWLRAGAPMMNGAAVTVGTVGALVAGNAGHPLAGVIDTAAKVESGTPGAWLAPGYTADGTHPTALGHATLATAILPASFTSTTPSTTASRASTLPSMLPTAVTSATLARWYKSESLPGAGNVASWPDSSANAAALTAAGTGNPVVVTAQANGLSVVRFPGGAGAVTPYMASASTAMTSAVALHAFVVGRCDGSNISSQTQILLTTVGGTNLLTFSAVGTTVGTLSSGSALAFAPQTGFAIYETIAGTGTDEARINGQLWGTGTHATFTPNGAVIGGANGSGSLNLNGDIAEVVVFVGALSAIERKRIHQYLSAKYAIAVADGVA